MQCAIALHDHYHSHIIPPSDKVNHKERAAPVLVSPFPADILREQPQISCVKIKNMIHCLSCNEGEKRRFPRARPLNAPLSSRARLAAPHALR